MARVFAIITDYQRYPEFLPELRSVAVRYSAAGVAVVRFEVQLIMRIAYTLRLVEDPPSKVTWSLAESKLISKNEGRWRLEEVGPEQTRASYALEVALAGMIPASVSTRLLGSNLPQMLERFKTRAESAASSSTTA